MIKLSYNEAKTIQESQIVFYRQLLGRQGVKEVRRRTKPCPPDINPDEPIAGQLE